VITIAKKKKSKFTGALVLIIFLLCLGIGLSLVFIFATQPASRPDEVIAEFASINLDNLLDELLELDLDENYPESPEDIIRLFNRTFWFLYNWDRDDIYTLSLVLDVQRGLYSQALLDLNPFTQQLANLVFSLEQLYDLNLELVGISQTPPVPDRFNPHDRLAISTVRYSSNGQNFRYDFHMFKHPQTQRWEIGLWVEN